MNDKTQTVEVQEPLRVLRMARTGNIAETLIVDFNRRPTEEEFETLQLYLEKWDYAK